MARFGSCGAVGDDEGGGSEAGEQAAALHGLPLLVAQDGPLLADAQQLNATLKILTRGCVF